MKVKTVFETYAEERNVEVAVHHDLNSDDLFAISIRAGGDDLEFVDVAGARELIRDLRAAIKLVQEG